MLEATDGLEFDVCSSPAGPQYSPKNEKRPVKIHHSRVLAVALAGAFVLIGASSLSATPGSLGNGSGCCVGDANGTYTFDASCQAHDVLKVNDDGTLAFYFYQDAGQLPAGAALPTRTIHNSFEQCFNSSAGVDLRHG